MIRLTAKAAMTNFNGYSFMGVVFLGLAIVAALSNGRGDFQPFNLLMSFGIIAASHLGLIVGTTLVEIKVKPLSFALPRQETSMAPAMLLVGTVVCAAYAILVLLRPMSIVDMPAPQQSLSVFGFSLGLFMLTVAVCVVTRDTAYLPLIVVIPFFLLFAAIGNETIAAPWLALNAALAGRPLLSLLFASLGVGLVFFVLGNRKRSRRLCGAPFLPLKAYDNPFKTEDYRSRMRSAAFRPSIMTETRSRPGGALLAALSGRLAGTSWDYLVLDTSVSRNRWELIFRVFSFLPMFVFVMYGWNAKGAGSPLFTLFFLVAWTFMFFPPKFKPRLSPMLPVGRRQHFRSFIIKGITVYSFAFMGMLLLQLIAGSLPNSGREVSAALAGIAELPFKGVLMAAATIPVLCWAYTKLRSTIGFILFFVLFLSIGSVFAAAYEPLMRLGYPAVLLVSALCWLPFIYLAWQRCHLDDLLLLP